MRTQIPTRIIVCAAFAMLIAGGRAFAQDRGGFTARADVGVGIQSDSSIEETAIGLSGLNVGVGGFLTQDLALMFRLSGTCWRGDGDEDNQGFGLQLGAGYSIYNRGKHNLQLGAHYSPAFTEPGTVHNFGFTFGYQFQ